MNNGNKRLSTGWMVLIFIVLITGIIVAGWLAPKGWNMIIIATLILVFMIILGLDITGRPTGILINERKLMSLSRFQLAIWTLIILSAYITIVIERVRAGNISDPLAIAIDWRLWALMGISTTSLVGSPLIHSTKKRKEPGAGESGKTADALKDGETEQEVEANREGILYGNVDICYARFADMFEGDELKNTPFVDMSKVQMFFFTLIAALSYAVLLFKMIITKQPAEMTSFPVLSDGLIAILGISHAGYLTNKAVDHTKLQ